MPRWFFQFYESFLELFVVVILGILAGVLLEKYFFKIKRFYPRNQLLAFVYGSILPVCSCGVVPLVESMQRKTSLKVIVTFIVATVALTTTQVTNFDFTYSRIDRTLQLQYDAANHSSIELWLVNLKGQTIYRFSLKDSGKESTLLPACPQGIYLIRLTDKEGWSQTRKLLL